MEHKDAKVLKELAKVVKDIAAKQEQEQRRTLWAAHHAMKVVRPPIYIRHAAWLKEVVGERLQCEDPFCRAHEMTLRSEIFHDRLDDDYIVEPFLTQRAIFETNGEQIWGLPIERVYTKQGGAARYESPIKHPDDFHKMQVPAHRIDQKKTEQAVERLVDALGGVLEVHVDTTPLLNGFYGDISTTFGRLRGFEQMLWDMVDRPKWVHRVMAFMRDGVLKVQREAQEAGDYKAASSENQSMPYLEGMVRKRANGPSVKRDQIWGFMAAQEFAGVSPLMHDEFLLRYQLPILKQYAAVAYGCCEDYTQKIDMLRKIPNLKRIAVSPFADIAKCAEQIGSDYICSWRPDPSEMVSSGFDPKKVQAHLYEGIRIFRKNGCLFDLCLKDIETIEHDPKRIVEFTKIARALVETA